jgi:hypothetical protein
LRLLEHGVDRWMLSTQGFYFITCLASCSTIVL